MLKSAKCGNCSKEWLVRGCESANCTCGARVGYGWTVYNNVETKTEVKETKKKPEKLGCTCGKDKVNDAGLHSSWCDKEKVND